MEVPRKNARADIWGQPAPRSLGKLLGTPLTSFGRSIRTRIPQQLGKAREDRIG